MITWFEKHNKISFMIFIILIITTIYFSSKQGDPVPKITFPYKAIIYHFTIFFLISSFLMISTSKGKNKDWIFFSFIFTIFYAFLDEIHQHFVPGRVSSLFDISINSIGSFLALILYNIRISQNSS